MLTHSVVSHGLSSGGERVFPRLITGCVGRRQKGGGEGVTGGEGARGGENVEKRRQAMKWRSGGRKKERKRRQREGKKVEEESKAFMYTYVSIL